MHSIWKLSFARIGVAALGTLALMQQGCSSQEEGDLSPTALPHPKPTTNQPPVASVPYRFIHPTSSESLLLESVYAVQWLGADSIAAAEDGHSLRLSLYRGDSLLGELGRDLPATGTYVWSVGSSRQLGKYRFGSGGDYRLLLSHLTDTSKFVFSDIFTVMSAVSGTLTLTSPGAGASVIVDSSLAITWTATGSIGPDVGVQLFQGSQWVADLALTEPVRLGRWVWKLTTLPAQIGDGYRIRIFASANPTLDQMGPAFSIVPRFSQSPYRFLIPSFGDTVVAGDSCKAVWVSDGDTGKVLVQLYRDSLFTNELGLLYEASDSLSFLTSVSITPGAYSFRVTQMADKRRYAHSPTFYIKSSSGDPYEPDDTMLQAKSITTDGIKQDRTIMVGNRDWIKFEAVTSKLYLIEIWTPSKKNLVLTDRNGQELARGSDGHSRLNLKPTYAGPYYFTLAIDTSYPISADIYEAKVTAYDTAVSILNLGLTAPASQDIWTVGATHAITWPVNRQAQGEMVTLELHDDMGPVRSIAIYLDNAGRYDWEIPSDIQPWDRYHIRMRSMRAIDNTQYVRSANFTVQAVP